MSPSSSSELRIAVIGAGISGLAAAHRVHELRPGATLTVFEASGQIGGVLRTESHDGFLLELSADNFITNIPWAIELCRRIGFDDQLIEPAERHRRALVVRCGKLYPVPAGFTLMAPAKVWPVLASPVLSPLGKLRLAAERFVPAQRQASDESLASFARRRLGREVFERLVQPLVGGIYTADPEKLSLQATLPRFLEMEQAHGSLTAGIRAAQERVGPDSNSEETGSGARYSVFVAPRNGMASLAEAVARRLPGAALRLNTKVRGLSPTKEGGWSLLIGDGGEKQFDGVILALPAPASAKLLQGVDAQLAADIAGIEHASSAVITLAYRRGQISHRLDAFGLVVPSIERRGILAASFSSVKYARRAPDDHALIRVFVGGALQSALLELEDAGLESLATQELAELLGIHGPPLFSSVTRWLNVMPQYHVGHSSRVERIENRTRSLGALRLAGNAYHGVGVPNCIHSGEIAAAELIEELIKKGCTAPSPCPDGP